MPTVECRALTVHYPAFTLGPLDLTLRAGERVALVGPNGAGKTTTVRAIAGRQPTYEGEVRVDGMELRGALPQARERIGYMPESLLGFGWMTIAEHLAFLPHFYETWDPDYADRLVRRLALDPEARLATLSKGTRVKLALVSAEAYRPPILLLDEPTSGIDPIMRKELITALHAALADPERLLLFSTHILEDVAQVAERVLVLTDGRIRADLTMAELRHRAGDGSITAALEEILTDDEDSTRTRAASA